MLFICDGNLSKSCCEQTTRDLQPVVKELVSSSKQKHGYFSRAAALTRSFNSIMWPFVEDERSWQHFENMWKGSCELLGTSSFLHWNFRIHSKNLAKGAVFSCVRPYSPRFSDCRGKEWLSLVNWSLVLSPSGHSGLFCLLRKSTGSKGIWYVRHSQPK